MSDISEILINTVSIPEVKSYFFSPVQSLPQNPPVTLQIGNPIIEVPGCVIFNPANEKSINLVNEDERGNRVLCDAGTPSFTPMDYQPENLIYVQDAAAPDVQQAPEVETEQPNLGKLPKNLPKCPGPNQPRVGDLTRNGKEIVVGHELNDDKTLCIVLYEPSSPVEKLLPNTSQVSNTGALAVVATASAAATPLLLRLIRPLIKQLIKKIQALLGKKIVKPSRAEIKTNKYREKKGLPPLKKK